MWKSLSLQNSTKIALDEKMRRYWLLRTLALTGQEIAGIRITAGKHWTVCCEEGMTVVNTKTEPVTRWAVRVKTFKPSDGEETESETRKSLDEQDVWHATGDKN